MRGFRWFLCLAGVVNATSVAPHDFKCPVCGKPSVDSVLMSYNNFGQVPARDRIFSPIGANVRICPHDLYASWNYQWEDLKPGDKESLSAFLKEPRVVLTDREKQIVGTRLDALRQSRWWEILWARTCDQVRKQDVDHARFTALQFYHAGDINSPEPWILELTKLYRDEAIKALENAKEARYRFLRAELLRLSGRNDEAALTFRKLAGDLKKTDYRPANEDEEEDREGMLDLCEEGLLLIEAVGCSSDRLAGWLIQPFPDRDPEVNPPAGWRRHRIALQMLVTRATGGDKQAGDTLWKAVSSDVKRLIALLETLEDIPGAPGVRSLVGCGDPWAAWLNGLATRAKAGKLPDALSKEPNRERCLNILQRFGPSSWGYMDEAWQKNILLPMVVQAAAKGSIPDIGLDRDDLAFALAELAAADIPHRDAVLKTIILILRDLPKPKDAPEYGICLSVVTLAEQSAKAAGVGIDGKWKCDWWKLVAEYATGKPGVGPALANDPLVSESFGGDGKAFEKLAYQLFAVRKDPVWKEKIVNVLQSATWLPDEPLEYAQSLGDRQVDAALVNRMARLRHRKAEGVEGDMSLYEIGHIEERTRKARMAALPVR